MSARSRRAALALLAAGLVLLSWIARTAQRIDFQMPGHDGWVTAEPDSAYHMRRVARVFAEGLPVAERDVYMNPPEGAIIPWPPYYTLVACALLAPALPADEAQRPGYIERGVASLPRVFATAATLVAFLAGTLLAGPAGGVAAGATHALCFASIQYGRLGNGDHHAWIELLGGGFLLLLSWSLGERTLARPRTAALFGAACGALAGLMIGSWVAALLYLVYADLALAWLLVRQARAPRAGLGAFGLALHVGALLALAPAVWSSPWKEEHPWMVVNLSWFHLAYPALAALVFVPLVAWTPSVAAARRYPWIVLGALVALGVALFAFDTAPARGIVEGFEWVSRVDAFMADVSESVPAIGPRAPPASETLAHMGYGLLLLLPAWAWMAWRAFAHGDERMLPWVVALPPMVAQAAGQWTFTRALALPMAVAVGAGLAAFLEGLARRRTGERPAWVVPAVLVAALALQWPTLADTARRARSDWTGQRNPSPRKKRALREAFDWLRAAPRTGDEAVMANWSFGHPIEWCADRPSVATNFGAYVGEECYRAPGRFFLDDDPRAAEAVLEHHTARYVLVTSQDIGFLPALVNTAPELGARHLAAVEGDGEQAKLLPSWYRTIGASLLLEGRPRSGARAVPGDSLDFLRLVHVSPVEDPNPALAVLPSPLPSTWIWERVAGATLEARAAPGTVLHVAFTVAYPGIAYTLRFERSATADASGTVKLRVPYATVEPNGDGHVQGEARWELGTRSGPLELRDADLREGRVIPIGG